MRGGASKQVAQDSGECFPPAHETLAISLQQAGLSLHIESLPFASHKRFKGRIADQAIRLQEIRQTTERPSTVSTQKAPHLNSQGLAHAISGKTFIIPMRLKAMISMTLGALLRRPHALMEILLHVGFDRVFDPDHFLHELKGSPKEEKKEAKKRRASPTARGGSIALTVLRQR